MKKIKDMNFKQVMEVMIKANASLKSIERIERILINNFTFLLLLGISAALNLKLIGTTPEPEIFTTWDFIKVLVVLLGIFYWGKMSVRKCNKLK